MRKLRRSPNGIRTRVSTLRGWCPRPLDDGAEIVAHELDVPAAYPRVTRRRARAGTLPTAALARNAPARRNPCPGRDLTPSGSRAIPGGCVRTYEVARGGGLEPPITGPEPVVLPITPPPNGRPAILTVGAGAPTGRGRRLQGAQVRGKASIGFSLNGRPTRFVRSRRCDRRRLRSSRERTVRVR